MKTEIVVQLMFKRCPQDGCTFWSC